MQSKNFDLDFMENYYVLAVSILKNKTPEEAFELYQTGEDKIAGYNKVITEDDVLDMIHLREKEGLSYGKIGQIYNLSDQAIYRRIKRYKKNKFKIDVA
jgi:hypothetical protein